MRCFGLLLLFFLHATVSCDAQPASSPARPNIVFIMADDLGYGEVGFNGQEKIRTPNIDRIAREGIQFTQHYSGAPVCAPARCVLMTGLHTGHAYVRDNKGQPVIGQLPIPPESVTVAELLKGAGYRTGAVGKWGLGGPGTTGAPNKQGFDFWYGYLDQWRAHYYYPDYLYRNEVKEPIPGNDGKVGKTYSHDLISNEALRFVDDAKSDEPFFLYVAYAIPHVSLQVPEDSLAEYQGLWEDPPYAGGHYTGHETPRAAYAAMITRMDRDIGRLLDRLKEKGLDENTIVVFTSDNGPTWAGGVDAKFFNSAGPLRGLKGSLYEGGIRVPTAVRWPTKIEPGSKSDHVSGFPDWLPTLTELAGGTTPAAIDGDSLLPTLLGVGVQKKHSHLYWEHGRRLQAVRMGDWKGVRLQPGAPIQLFDLASDLSESTDVASLHPEVVKKIATIMANDRTESEHFPLLPAEVAKGTVVKAAAVLSTVDALPKAGWKIVRVSSESAFNGKTGDQAIDGVAATWWHTEWQGQKPDHPHELVIDLGQERTIEGVRYLARQDGGWNGTIRKYEICVGSDPEAFGAPVHRGEFEKTKKEQEARFESSAKGRYVLLRTRSAHDNQPFAAIGELGLIGK